CINRIEPVSSGRILVHGVEVTAADADVNAIRRNIGIVFQSFNLFPHMTVIDNITLGPRKVLRLSRSDADERGMALLQRFGLAERRAEYPDRLSGGQQQRVAIMRALAMQPPPLLVHGGDNSRRPALAAGV